MSAICDICNKPVTKTQLKHADAIKDQDSNYTHTDCIDDLSRPEGDAYRKTPGGRRPGAGRPPIGDEPMDKFTVTLPDPVAESLRELGEGNLSAGIRRLYQERR